MYDNGYTTISIFNCNDVALKSYISIIILRENMTRGIVFSVKSIAYYMVEKIFIIYHVEIFRDLS